MSSPLLAALALLLCAVVVVSASSAAFDPQYARAASARCGALSGDLANNVFNIRAVKVSCSKARRVARQWVGECASDEDGSCRVSAGFYCRYRDGGYEQGTIRCGRDKRKVAFDTGA